MSLTGESTAQYRKSLAATAAAFVVLSPFAASAQTAAGVAIPNIAQLSFSVDGTTSQVASSAAILRTDEILDIALSARTNIIDAPVSGTAAIAFTLANSGNGLEAFALSGSCEGGRIAGFAIDSDGDGLYDPARDANLADARTARLSPGASQPLFVLVEQVAAGGTKVTVNAHADTASGTPGTLSPGRGDDGVDAVVGATTADATLQFSIAAGSSAQATLEKSQSVTTRDGRSSDAMSRAVVTYSLIARFTGGTARNAVISDPIPANTRYLPGTLTIDGAIMSDAVDTDGGSFDGQAIRAELGTIAGPATRSVTFQVVIQ